MTNDLETLKEDRRKLKVEDEEGGGQRLTTLSVLYSRDVSDFCLKSLSLTRSVAMKIYWNKKERLHKKRN